MRRRDPCEDVEREHFSDRAWCKGQAVRMIANCQVDLAGAQQMSRDVQGDDGRQKPICGGAS